MIYRCPLKALADLYSHHKVLLNLELSLALYHAEQSKAWVEEVGDEAAIYEDMAAKECHRESHFKCFKARYPELEVDEDPFVELPLDAKMPAPTEVPFDDHPTTPPTLPPLS
ncbi:hypothetical protein B296_00023908 [Ensete ventricosum]|uniref:Uncharacterized protein n=1 Tax=Ensete ventricosum TaxID=4639 RepID=A0A426YTR8_ENSVE|nr:hypothetical protein B296_00023908 [Ensete ventricosum]